MSRTTFRDQSDDSIALAEFECDVDYRSPWSWLRHPVLTWRWWRRRAE